MRTWGHAREHRSNSRPRRSLIHIKHPGPASGYANSIVLSSLPLWLIFAIALVAIGAAGEFGRRYGVRRAKLGARDIGTLEGAILGLLALMISFTFAMALARYDSRREAVLTEANAIGTTALRARLLPAPFDHEALGLLRSYVQLRIDTPREPSPEVLARTVSASNDIQEQLWRLAERLKDIDQGMVPTGLFLQSLNDMIDQQAVRLAHFRNRVPDIVLLVLYGIACVGIAFAGYADGLANITRQRPVQIMAVIVSVAIWLIQDLDRPGAGFLRTDLQPLLDVAASLAVPAR